MLHKMMRRFDASDEHTKDLRNDLAGKAQKVDTRAISIKYLELQMDQFSATEHTATKHSSKQHCPKSEK